jgi:hypothetical protein
MSLSPLNLIDRRTKSVNKQAKEEEEKKMNTALE